MVKLRQAGRMAHGGRFRQGWGIAKTSTLALYTNFGIFGAMVRHPPQKDEKPVRWVGSSKSDFLEFPACVISNMSHALGVAQLGGKHPAAKLWKGEGPGVFELAERFESNHQPSPKGKAGKHGR